MYEFKEEGKANFHEINWYKFMVKVYTGLSKRLFCHHYVTIKVLPGRHMK